MRPAHQGAGGFEVERGVAGLATAFVARTGSGAGPRVALLLEYDALPLREQAWARFTALRDAGR